MFATTGRETRFWITALMTVGLAAGSASAQGTFIDGFDQMTNGAFLDVQGPGGGFVFLPFDIAVGGRTVTVFPVRGSDLGTPFSMGSFTYVGTLVSFQLPINPVTDPGDRRGHYQEGAGQGDLILNFSEPLTGFGITSTIDTVLNAGNRPDTFTVYDAINGTGTPLGTATQRLITQKVYLDFVGIITPTPQIRSARIPLNPSIAIDGYAVSILSGPVCGSADFDCDGDTGTDADIEAFFRCLGGNCPPPSCGGSSDFNGDGDSGTDADIEAFFRVLGGGPC